VGKHDRLPWFPFYAADWLTDPDVRAMTYAERGLYLECLCMQWREGSIPSDVKRLARITGAPAKLLHRILGKFEPSRDGELQNARMEKVRREQRKAQRQRSQKARDAANARWKQSPGNAPSTAPAMPADAETDAETETDADTHTHTGSGVASLGSCPLHQCDGNGAVRNGAGRILKTCTCPRGVQRRDAFKAHKAAEDRAAAGAPPKQTRKRQPGERPDVDDAGLTVEVS